MNETQTTAPSVGAHLALYPYHFVQWPNAEGKGAWECKSGEYLLDALQSPGAPPLYSVLGFERQSSRSTEVKAWAGPLYFDFDAGKSDSAVKALELLRKLEALDVDPASIRIYLSGKKGVHVEVAPECFGLGPGEFVEHLPGIFKRMIVGVGTQGNPDKSGPLYVEGLDASIYSRGRLWRTPNVKRPDCEAYKVSVSTEELQGMTPELYDELVKGPRPYPPLAPPKLAEGLAAHFNECREFVKHREASNGREPVYVPTDADGMPPEMRKLFDGEIVPPRGKGWNDIATQLAVWARAHGWSASRLVNEASGIIASHVSSRDSKTKTTGERTEDLNAKWGAAKGYGLSFGALRLLFPKDMALMGLAHYFHEIEYGDDAEEEDKGSVDVARAESEADTKQAPRKLPLLFVKRGEHKELVDAAVSALAAAPEVFNRLGELVRLESNEGHTSLASMDRHKVGYELGSLVKLCDERGNPADPSRDLCEAVLSASPWSGVKRIERVAVQPAWEQGGGITSPGYDAAAKTLGHFNPADYPPSEAGRDELVREFEHLLSGFEFGSTTDKAGALAAILTAALRPIWAAAPAFVFNAADKGSGKTTLAKVVTLFACTPTARSVPTWAGSGEERRKVLTSILMKGTPAALFDNVREGAVINDEPLASAITEGVYAGRELGTNRLPTLAARTLWLFTGNNVRPGRDLARRCMVVNLSPISDNPAGRTFEFDPEALVSEARGAWVMKALGLVELWHKAGKPPHDWPAVGSFGEWGRTVRGVLHWLGYDDPAQSLFESIEQDDDRDLLRVFIDTWRESDLSGQGVTVDVLVKRAIKAANDDEGETLERGFWTVLTEVAGAPNRDNPIDKGRVSYWLRSVKGRVVGGWSIETIGTRTKAGMLWRLERKSTAQGGQPLRLVA